MTEGVVHEKVRFKVRSGRMEVVVCCKYGLGERSGLSEGLTGRNTFERRFRATMSNDAETWTSKSLTSSPDTTTLSLIPKSKVD